MNSRHILRTGRQFVHDEEGSVVVELALMLMIMLMLAFGIIDFGRALYWSNNLNAGVREGARYAAILQNPVASKSAIQDTVLSRINLLGGDTLSASDVVVTYNYAGTALQSTTVSVSHPFSTLTPIAQLAGFDTITLSASARFRWELAP